MPELFLVVAYDVSRTRRRARLRRRLKGLLPPVQKSVFEGPLPGGRVDDVRRAVADSIDPGLDTVRVYHLCVACRRRTELFGTSVLIPDEAEDVVVE